MSTITCSTFLRKNGLSSYEDGRYLLTVHGQFLELYELDKFFRDDFNAREYVPIRTLVFERHNVQWYTVLADTGHVFAIFSEYSKKGVISISACLVHRDQLLEGGYADTSNTHKLFDGYSSNPMGGYVVTSIEGTTDMLLLTETKFINFRYTIDGADVSCDVIASFEIKSLLPPSYANSSILPMTVNSSTNYSFVISIGDQHSSIRRLIMLLQRVGDRWNCRTMEDMDETRLIVKLPGLDIAVAAGKSVTKFFSTSSCQSGVSKSQLRVLNQRYEDVITRTMATCTKEDATYVYVLGEKDLALWKVAKQSITYERTFLHSSVNVEERCTLQRDALGISKGIAIYRKMLRNAAPDFIYDRPISAIVMSRKMEEVLRDFLIISYESGDIKVIRTDDIIKNPMCTYVPLGLKKLPMKSLNPCWEFPLDPINPLSRLTGLSNGVPTLIQLRDGAWDVEEFIKPSSVRYSYVKSRTSPMGQTLAVFFNQHDICFCRFDKNIQWREERLDCKIKDCFISGDYVCILMDHNLLIVDICGFLKGEGDADFVCNFIRLHTLNLRNGGKGVRIESFIVFKSIDEEIILDAAVVHFNKNQMWTFGLTESKFSRGNSLQEMLNREVAPRSLKDSPSNKDIRDTITTSEGNFYLFEKSVLLHQKGGMKPSTKNLLDYFPKNSTLDGFITIEGTTISDRTTYVMARSEGFLFLKDALTMDDITSEPIPSGFGKNLVFGHFIGPKTHGRCALYTISTRKFGDVPELMRIEARVNFAHTKDCLTRSGSLFQPDTVVQFAPHKERSAKFTTNLVSSCGKTIEVHEMNGKGTFKLIWQTEMRNAKDQPIFVTNFDTFYVHSSNTLYIVAGSIQGELVMAKWDQNTNQHSYCEFLLEKVHILEAYFFGKEHATDAPNLIAYLYGTIIKIYKYDHETNGVPAKIHELRVEGDPREKCLVVCNGDAMVVHDIWMIYHHEVVLHPGRHLKFTNKTLRYTFPSLFSTGKAEESFSVTTRNNETSGLYADFIFVVRDKGRIGVLATVQTIEQLPEAILFTELSTITNTKSIALHVELLGFSAVDKEVISVNIRLYVAKKKSITISLLKLSIETGCLKVIQNEKLGKIATTVFDPSYLTVSTMEDIPHRKTPKYCILSGNEGTQVVRICPKKLEDRTMTNSSEV